MAFIKLLEKDGEHLLLHNKEASFIYKCMCFPVQIPMGLAVLSDTSLSLDPIYATSSISCLVTAVSSGQSEPCTIQLHFNMICMIDMICAAVAIIQSYNYCLYDFVFKSVMVAAQIDAVNISEKLLGSLRPGFNVESARQIAGYFCYDLYICLFRWEGPAYLLHGGHVPPWTTNPYTHRLLLCIHAFLLRFMCWDLLNGCHV